jgi:hypothetical protein
MKNKLRGFSILMALMLLTACGGGGSDSGGSGRLAVSLTDAATDRYQAVYVTIEDIQVHLSGSEERPNNWRSIEIPGGPITVNLLELVNGVREELGLTTLPAGHYTQMRLIIGRSPDDSSNLLGALHPHANYVIETDGDKIHPLKIPSGYNTGIKLVHGFDILADQTTELLLDFDANRSVVEAGNSGLWLLKPTIRVITLSGYALVEGLVTAEDGSPVEGALVSLQHYDATAADPRNEVVVQAGTSTGIEDDDGFNYRLFVEAGTYNLVAWTAGKAAAFSRITLLAGGTLVEDPVLADAPQGDRDRHHRSNRVKSFPQRSVSGGKSWMTKDRRR